MLHKPSCSLLPVRNPCPRPLLRSRPPPPSISSISAYLVRSPTCGWGVPFPRGEGGVALLEGGEAPEGPARRVRLPELDGRRVPRPQGRRLSRHQQAQEAEDEQEGTRGETSFPTSRPFVVMEWVIRERPYKLKELDYSYLLEFTTKLHGISFGERLFSHIPANFHNELLYNNLVMACLDKGVVRLSLAYMKRMRELGFPISPFVYNRLIILHSSPDRKKVIPKFLTQMKADGVSPHTSTYNILLKIEADDHNIDELCKVFADMKKAEVEPNEITYCILATAHAVARLYTVSEVYVEAIEKTKTGDNWSTLDVLLILYGYLGKEKELERTWKTVQDLPHVRSQSFGLAIEAFGRLSQVDRSEELWEEMKSIRKLKSTKQFNSIISVYCRHGLLEKASELFKEMEAKGCSPNAITFRHLALGCLRASRVKEALKTLEVGEVQAVTFQVRRSFPWLETTHLILDAFADMGDLANAKKFFLELKECKYSRYAFVHNTLLRAHFKAKVYDPDLLTRMILGGARPDAETYSLLRLIEHFKT